jgi:hypothetical protein
LNREVLRSRAGGTTPDLGTGHTTDVGKAIVQVLAKGYKSGFVSMEIKALARKTIEVTKQSCEFRA